MFFMRANVKYAKRYLNPKIEYRNGATVASQKQSRHIKRNIARIKKKKPKIEQKPTVKSLDEVLKIIQGTGYYLYRLSNEWRMRGYE